MALVVAMIMAVIAGILVGTPVIRMRGDYLAIVTLGFGEIVRVLLLSDWLEPYFGGAQGIRDIPGIPLFGREHLQRRPPTVRLLRRGLRPDRGLHLLPAAERPGRTGLGRDA